MKNNQTQSSTLQSSFQTLLHNSSNSNYILCSQNQISKHSCLNKKCTKNAFVCENKSCICRIQHQGCIMIETQTIINSLMGKIISTQQLYECVNKQIQKTIDHFSDFRDQLLTDIKQKYEFIGLNEDQKNFLNALKQGKTSQITGKILWQAQIDFQPIQQIIQNQTNFINTLSNKFSNLNDDIKIFEKIIQAKFNEFQNINLRYIKAKDRINKWKLDAFLSSNLISTPQVAFTKSKIINSLEQCDQICKFFELNVIKKIQLIYQASQNGFQIPKFHSKCDNIPHTLTLCETQFNKKVGGYTPLTWNGLTKGQYKADESGESFIFSLTNKDKFILQQKSKAIYNFGDYGPTFGYGHDLCIQKKANDNSESRTNLMTSYINGNYIKDDKISLERYNGNVKSVKNFKIKQWQVWKIQF